MFSFKIVLVASLSLALLLSRIYTTYHNLKPYQEGEKVTFTATILTKPKVAGKFQRFTLRPEGREEVFITAPFYPQISYGQQLTIDGVVKLQEIAAKLPENSSRDGSTVLRTENVINTMFFPKIEAKENPVFAPLASIRKNLIIIFSSFLSPASSGLLLGIVFGIRSTMPQDLYNSLRDTGVIHITAASGMNVTMVAGAIFYIFATFLKRQSAIVVSILFVWLYAVLAGLEPSILRASIMTSFAFGAGLVGRQNTSILALLLTGYVMLFLDPLLLTDIGFQLSFLSTLGIILLSPLLKMTHDLFDPLKAKGRQSILLLFSQDIKTTVAAQLATLPILFFHFGLYNLLSVVANALILWTIPPLMILGGLGGLVGLLFKPLAAVFLYLSLPLLLYIEAIITFFSRHTLMVQVSQLPIIIMVGYYLLLVSLLMFTKSSNRNPSTKLRIKSQISKPQLKSQNL